MVNGEKSPDFFEIVSKDRIYVEYALVDRISYQTIYMGFLEFMADSDMPVSLMRPHIFNHAYRGYINELTAENKGMIFASLPQDKMHLRITCFVSEETEMLESYNGNMFN